MEPDANLFEGVVPVCVLGCMLSSQITLTSRRSQFSVRCFTSQIALDCHRLKELEFVD